MPPVKRIAGLLALVLYVALIVEAFSYLYFRFGFGRLAHAPAYALPEAAAQALPLIDWYTHLHPWGAWHRPNSRAYHINWCYEAFYSSNSEGARDVERARTGRDRALFLGDSFVEGYTVNDSDRLTNLLEERYGLPVLNFATGGHFGPLQYEILYRELGMQFDHRHLFVGLLADNDFTDNDAAFWRRAAEYRELYRPYYTADGGGAFYPNRPPASALEPRGFGRTLTEWARRYTWTFGIVKEVRRVVLERQHRGEFSSRRYAGYRDASDEQLRNVMGSLGRLAEMAAQQNRRMTIVLFPRPADYALAASEVKIKAPLERFAAERGVQLIDLRDLLVFDRDLFQACDGHWSPKGNRAAAEAIFSKVPEL
jgi:hypothetical protein